MAIISFDTGERSLQDSQKALIRACIKSILTGRFDQLKLLISQTEPSNGLKRTNKVHDTLCREKSDLNLSVWDKQISELEQSVNWIHSALCAIMIENDLEKIRSAGISKSSNIASLGSCFATNISKHFRSLQYQNTYTLRVEEAVNSPRLIDMYFNPQKVPLNQRTQWDSRFGVESKYIIDIIPKIDLFILTFGVGWDIVDEKNNICLSLDSLKSRLSTGELKFLSPELNEQSSYISSCIESIRALNSSAQVLVTLSPVPLSGFFGEKHVFRANSISKSSLLLAIEHARSKSDFVYVPTYEIVTSLAPILFKNQVWGEDGTTRHPNNDLIRAICEAFTRLL